jgi:hypothetical protein
MYKKLKNLKDMIETKTYYDQETGDLTVEYKNNLLIDYSDILGKIFVEEKSKDLPSNSRIEHIESNRINLIVNLKGRMKQVDKNRMQIPTEVAESINRVFNRFASEAMTKKSMSFEIIPLKNYDVENIKEDIKSMVENSRDLCVISDYKDYLDSKKIPAEEASFVQAEFKYLSDDYCNIVIAATSGDMTEVNAIVKDKMRKTDWM